MLKHSLYNSNGTIALVALTLGYIVCSLAKKETGLLKKIGYIIGVAVIIISSVIVIVKVQCVARICPMKSMMMHDMPAESLLQK